MTHEERALEWRDRDLWDEVPEKIVVAALAVEFAAVEHEATAPLRARIAELEKEVRCIRSGWEGEVGALEAQVAALREALRDGPGDKWSASEVERIVEDVADAAAAHDARIRREALEPFMALIRMAIDDAERCGCGGAGTEMCKEAFRVRALLAPPQDAVTRSTPIGSGGTPATTTPDGSTTQEER